MSTDVALRLRRWLTGRRRAAATRPLAVLPPTPAEVEAVRLLIDGASEARDRQRLPPMLEALVAGDDAALSGAKPHSIALSDNRSPDVALMTKVEVRLADSHDPGILSKLAGLRVQMRDWDGALALYDRLAARGPLSTMDALLAFQVARIEGHRDRMAAFDESSLQPLVDHVPEVRADLAARFLTLGQPHRFAQDIRRTVGFAAEADALARMAEELPRLPHGTGGFQGRLAPADWQRIVTVSSMGNNAGGSAIQDFIADHADVWTTAREYVALSGYMGFRSAHQSKRPVARTIQFARLHLLGLTVPVNRAGSRVLRQARADRAAGLTPAFIQAIHRGLDEEKTVRDFLDSLLLSAWRTYLDAAPGVLLMNKMFSGGRLDLLSDLPPFRCIMVWRDPRDQYAEQVARGWVKAGDTATFIATYLDKLGALKASLRDASEAHRALFVNVGFEKFVGSVGYRARLRRRLGLAEAGYVPSRFKHRRSAANVGIWRERLSAAEAAAIEAALAPYLDTAAIDLDLNGAV